MSNTYFTRGQDCSFGIVTTLTDGAQLRNLRVLLLWLREIHIGKERHCTTPGMKTSNEQFYKLYYVLPYLKQFLIF